LLGSIPVGVIVGKLRGFDPRTVGSGNIGMTNVARAGGKSAAALTFAGDLLKGLLPVALARWIFGPLSIELASVGFAAFLGSIASIFLGFRGGRGVATSIGVWLMLAPVPILIALAVFGVILTLSRIVSLASLGAAMSLPAATAVSGAPRHYVLLAIVMAALVLLRHRENIRRLMGGEEPRIGERKHG
jgi:glycerol-3-phosphate acyltransferase PlsY